MKIICIIVILISGLAVIFSMYKSGHLMKSILTSIFQGLASLMAVNVLGLLTGVSIALNWYTIGAVCLFGMPSTVGIVLLDTFLK